MFYAYALFVVVSYIEKDTVNTQAFIRAWILMHKQGKKRKL